MLGRKASRVPTFHVPSFGLCRVAWFVAATTLAAGCAPFRGPVEPPPVDGAPDARTDFAAPWTSVERAAVRQAVLQGVEPTNLPSTPAVGALGPVRYTPVPGRVEMSTDAFFDLYSDAHQIAPGAVGERVEVHQSWLKRGPAAVVEGGQLHLRFESLRPVGPVEASLGFELWGPRFAESVYRQRVRSPRTPALTHDLAWPIAKLVRQKYDVTQVRQKGRGVIAYRIQAMDADRFTTHVEDGRVAFRCEVPCDADAEVVQLPTIVLGPFVDQVTATSAIVSFETDVPTFGAVQLKDAAGGVRLIRSSRPGVRHEIEVPSLTPAMAYRYLVAAVDRRGEVVDVPYGTLRTPPLSTTRFRFAVMSDSRSAIGGDGRHYNGVNRNVLERLMQQAVNEDVDFAVFAGDLIDGYVTVQSEYKRQLRAWMQSVEPFHMHLPIYEVMGNHELLADAWSEGWMADRSDQDNSQTLFAASVVNPTNGPPTEPGKPPYTESVYSFDYGSAHFAMVNSNHWHRNRFERDDHPALPRGQREGMLSDAQLGWLDRDLTAARARGAAHLFVFTHEPAFPTGGHAQDAMYYRGRIPEVLAMRDRFWGILVKHGAVAAFFGDEHNYSRTLIDSKVDPKFSRPVWNIVTGGAGAPYYARDFTVPWAESVKAFRPDHHFLVISVDGPRVRLEARNLRQEVIDSAMLAPRPN